MLITSLVCTLFLLVVRAAGLKGPFQCRDNDVPFKPSVSVLSRDFCLLVASLDTKLY